MKTRMNYLKYFVILVFAVLGTTVVWSADVKVLVGSANELRTTVNDAANNPTNTYYIQLVASPIELGDNPIVISAGKIVLDLNDQTLSAARENDGAAICIEMKGGFLTIVGGGTVSATAKGTTGGFLGSGKNGYDASTINYSAGTLNIQKGTFMATATNGAGIIAGSDGTSYSLKSVKTIDDIVMKGSVLNRNGEYMTDYSMTGFSQKGASSSFSVEIVDYKLTYNPAGGTNPTSLLTSYTIETKDISFPPPLEPKKKGYDFNGWYYESGQKADVESLFPRATSNPYERNLTTHWEAIRYPITYNLNEGVNTDNPQDYTIESEISLKDPTRAGYKSMGWYDNKEFTGNAVTSIPQGSTEPKIFYAKWSKLYAIQYYTTEGTGPSDASYVVEDTPFNLPKLTPPDESYKFMGWCAKNDFTDDPIFSLPKGTVGDKVFYAKWNRTYYITYHWQVPEGKPTMTPMGDEKHPYTKDDAVTLETPVNGAYQVAGWYDNAGLQGSPVPPVIPKGTEKNFELYAKWEPAKYSIKFETYYGSFPTGVTVPDTYTYESENITLPNPIRSGYTFAGWYTDAALTNGIATLEKNSMGNKTFYAKWTLGNAVSILKPTNGRIVVNSGNIEIKNNEKVGAGIALTVTAIPDSSIYSLTKLTIGSNIYTTTSVDTIMPGNDGLTISAEFADLRPSASAPKVITTPSITDYIPAGESVTVSLVNTDAAATLYYSIDGSAPKLYTQPFQISSLSVDKTIRVDAYAKKNGYKDGVTTRNITFGKGKITITFVLPKGVTAVNPEGGEVISAVASGGTFEFKLVVDKNYFESLDDLKVMANNKELLPNTKGVYTLNNQTGNITVNVSGITGITHTVTLKQSANGYICFTGDDEDSAPRTVSHGDRVSITAKGDADYKFFSWTDGTSDNPRLVLVEKDTTIQARFVQEDPGFLMVLPTLTGAKVKPLTGYSTSVKKGGTFKFYISKESDYSDSEPVVYANGEKLTVYKDVYSLYNIAENYVISVDGIRLNKTTLKLADNVIAFNMETAKQITNEALTPTTMVYLLAKSPAGKRFSMWNDGKVDNPRIIAVKDAQQLLPLFVSLPNENLLKVDLPVIPGAGMGAVNANAEALKSGDNIQLKLVILPQYSKSSVKVTANGDVVEPDLALRSSTETKTQFYTLNNVSDNVKVEVSGLELNNYTFSLEQNKGGRISASKTGTVKHGTVVTVTATPDNGNLFLKWSDGNTLNPYPYTVTDNCVLSAQFGNASIPLDNESIQKDGVRIYTKEHTLYIETAKTSNLQVWGFSGQMVYNVSIPEGHSAFYLLSGEYIVKVGDNKPVKVSIR